VTADLRRAEQPRLLLELALVEMCRASQQVPLGQLAARLLEMEQRLGGADVPAPAANRAPQKASPRPKAAPPEAKRTAEPKPAVPAAPTPKAEPAPEPGPAPEAATPPAAAPAGDAVALWARCLEELKGTSIRFWGTLQTLSASGLDEDGTLVLASDGVGLLQGEALKDPECHQALEAALSAAGATRAKFRMATDEPAGKKKPRPRGKAKAEPAGETKDERSMGEIFQEEPRVQKVLDMFDGEVLE
jgi:DNA polymerase III gamma/tau subunit